MKIASRLFLQVLPFTALLLVTNFMSIASVSANTRPARNGMTYVGGDIHTLTYTEHGLFLTGHESGSVSTDEGMTWKSIPSFKNTDIMSWATTREGFLAGGHGGLYRSTLSGKSFVRYNFFGKVSDVHALGASGQIIYMGSPEVGFLTSKDGGRKWKLINKKFGQGFMGSMLVDPVKPLTVIAPDMNNGLVWARFGGPSGVMSVAWNPGDSKEILALGMGTVALTKDNGKNWISFPVPMGASAVSFSPNGKKIFIAVLTDKKASVLTSSNDGRTWN
jgi:photosystem II stability/assembly factor-like uncharacterized protein